MDKKGWLTILLGMCCFLAGALHIQVEPHQKRQLKTSSQLDSLITQTTYDFRISSGQLDINAIRLDSLFLRKVYTIDVPGNFSKTTFHQHLRHRLYPLDVETYGTVHFPERDLEIQIVYNNTVHRTVKLRTDSDLENKNSVIPRLPD